MLSDRTLSRSLAAHSTRNQPIRTDTSTMIRRILAAATRTTTQWAQQAVYRAPRRLTAALPSRTLRRAALVALAAPVVLSASLVAAEPTTQSTAAASTSSAEPPSDDRLIAAEDAECPWCAAMRAGPCASEFTRWRNCSKAIQMQERAEAEAKQRDAASPGPLPSSPPRRSRATVECMPLFKLMDVCVRTPGEKRDYYSQILPLDDRQPTAAEKIKDAQSE